VVVVLDAVVDVLPEWEAFTQTVQARRPDAGTWCEGWTVHDVLAHQTGNAEELTRVLEAHMAGNPVETRGFGREERYRAMADAELWSSFVAHCERLVEVTQAASRELPGDAKVMWTGRSVSVPFFAEHMREELVLHCWDVSGDDTTARHGLASPWMTRHTVEDVGKPLLRRGAAGLAIERDGPIEGRLRSPGTDDVVVTATKEGNAIGFDKPDGQATIWSDPATRVLFLWGRRPADPSGWYSQAGPKTLGRVRSLLSGY
jgi:uncharacterized protein (TIGR03083 family)